MGVICQKLTDVRMLRTPSLAFFAEVEPAHGDICEECDLSFEQ